MPIAHAVLGLLARGPSYGYELKGSFEEAIGPQWGSLSIGHLYQVLDRLVRSGLVTSTVVRQQERPDKIVYELTNGGREELDRWLAEAVTRRSGYRDDFFLKLFVSSRLGEKALAEVIRVQRESYLGELASLSDLRHRHQADPLRALLLEAAILHTRASLELVERADEEASRIAREYAASEAASDAGAARSRHRNIEPHQDTQELEARRAEEG